jgi:hypothetical protein
LFSFWYPVFPETFDYGRFCQTDALGIELNFSNLGSSKGGKKWNLKFQSALSGKDQELLGTDFFQFIYVLLFMVNVLK